MSTAAMPVKVFSSKTANRLLPLFLALGAFSQIAQALLIRELLVVFQGNEISIGAFYGGWLFWIAVGSWGAIWFARWWARCGAGWWARWGRGSISTLVGEATYRPWALIQGLLILLPMLLLLQIGVVRSARLFLEVPAGQFIPLGMLLLSTFILTLPVGFTLGFVFPLACKGLESERADPVTSLYIVESLGALLGAMLFTFFLVDGLQVWHTLGLLVILMGSAGWTLHPLAKKPGEQTNWGRNSAVLVVLAGLVLVITPVGAHLTKKMEQLRFASLHPTLSLQDSMESRYGHISVGKLGEQLSVVEDGRITASFPDPRRIALEGAFFHTQAAHVQTPGRVLLFGGINDGLASELLKYSIGRLDAVVQDQNAFERIRLLMPNTFQTSFNDSRIFMHFGDGRGFVNQLQEDDHFDLVLVLVSDPGSVSHNRYYTRQFYVRLKNTMNPDGVLCTRVSGASNYLGRDVKSYSGSVFQTMSAVFEFIIAVPGDDHTFCAASRANIVSTDAKELERRYQNAPPKGTRLPNQAFITLLQAERVNFLRNRLEAENGELNTDLKPVTFFLNMVLWGKFTASGIGDFLERMRQMGGWPYLVPLAVYVVLFLLRGIGGARSSQSVQPYMRQAALFALMVLGFISMAAQLLILFGFQAQIGAIYGRIALLNGLFMSGLALGAYLPRRLLSQTQQPVLYLVLTLLSVATGCFLFPTLLNTLSNLEVDVAENVYYSLSTIIGIMAGAGFPLAVTLTQGLARDSLTVGGLVEAGDHLGGSLGGLVTGALLVPVLGMAASAELLAAMALLAIPPLLLAKWRNTYQKKGFGFRFFNRRNHAAFAHPSLTRFVWFVLGSVAILSWVARATVPGPQVLFGQDELEAISTANHFTFSAEPVPFYLGAFVDKVEGVDTIKTKTKIKTNSLVALSSMPVAGDIRGYAGPLNLLVAVDRNGKLLGVHYVASDETPSYTQDIHGWLEKLAGFNPVTHPLNLEELDGMSGATITSKAALESINRTVAYGLFYAFGQPIAQESGEERWFYMYFTPNFLGAVTMLLLLPVVYLRGRKKERLLYLFASVCISGATFNLLFTEVDLVNVSFGHFSSWTGNPTWWLLVLLVVPLMLLFGQVYCGLYCPFGALGEWISRMGSYLGWQQQVDPGWDKKGRHGKFLLLALACSIVWITGDVLWISFNPMQQLFGFHLENWLMAIAFVVLLGSLFLFRFWCRYWCPLGAFFALSNKLALLDRWAPRRYFNLCDLGVDHPFDIDCIRCQNCSAEANEAESRPAKRSRANGILALFMILTGGMIAMHLWVSWVKMHQESGGWRRIDIQAVKSQISSGRLSSQQAEWFRLLEK